METQLTQSQFHYRDIVLETELKEAHQAHLLDAQHDGRDFGGRNQPGPEESNFELFIEPIKGKYQSLIHRCEEVLQSKTNASLGTHDKETADEKIQTLDEDLNNQEKERKKLENLKSSMQLSYPWKWFYLIQTGIAIISFGEAWFTGQAMQIFGSGLLFSILISFIIGIILFGIAHLIPRAINYLGKTANQKRITAIIILLSLASVFYIFGVWRSLYLEKIGMQGIEPWSFMIINLFFMSAAVALSFFGLPSKTDRMQKEEWDAVDQSIARTNSKIKDLQHQKFGIKDSSENSRITRVQIIQYEHNLKGRISSMYLEAIGVFRTENLKRRTDRKVPECFSQPITELIIV